MPDGVDDVAGADEAREVKAPDARALIVVMVGRVHVRANVWRAPDATDVHGRPLLLGRCPAAAEWDIPGKDRGTFGHRLRNIEEHPNAEAGVTVSFLWKSPYLSSA